MLLLVVSAIALASVASAQQPEWAQCGGIGWTGSTTCVSGATCTEMNDYYSQCTPSTASAAPASSSAVPAQASATAAAVPGVNYWMSFGDSYTTTGFNISTGPLPSLSNPLGNPAYPGYTGGGGANWVDYLTLSFNQSLVMTYNFAYGGATIDSNLVTPYLPTVLSLTDQVNEFLSTVANKPASTPWTAANTLFSFWIGINDVGNSYGNGGGSAFDTTLMNAYFALVQKMYNAGARNFLFVNVPPIDRSPLMLAESTSAQALEKSVIADFNSQLVQNVNSFTAANSGVNAFIWDSNAIFTKILNAPQSFGFVDATSFGSTGDFWGNNYHPGAAAHQLLAQDAAKALAGSIWA